MCGTLSNGSSFRMISFWCRRAKCASVSRARAMGASIPEAIHKLTADLSALRTRKRHGVVEVGI